MLCPLAVVAGAYLLLLLNAARFFKLLGCAEAGVSKPLFYKAFSVGLVDFGALALLIGRVIAYLLIAAYKALVNFYSETVEPAYNIINTALNLALFIGILNSGVENSAA